MSPIATSTRERPESVWWALIRAAIFLYVFLLAVAMMGGAFKLLGGGFAKALVAGTSNPFAGLFIGVLATSLAQSSSLTTSVVVGLVASGTLTTELAVPVIMGANVGTSITNLIVTLGHLRRSNEFRRALAAATVHDFFNWAAVILFLPLQVTTGFLSKMAGALANVVVVGDGVSFTSPTKAMTKPVIHVIQDVIQQTGLPNTGVAIVELVLSLALLFLALVMLTKTMKGILLSRLQPVLSSSFARNAPLAIVFGLVITAIAQSSSITTSLLVPMAAAGVLRLNQVYPVTLGANVGTTVTALLAATVGSIDGLAIAFAHLLFNVIGILVLYVPPPVRPLIPKAARRFAIAATKSRRLVLIFILGVFFVLPGLVILIDHFL
ncbi:MAG: Na/Pi symporter [Candidatus Eisenbacteria bacterium]|nr:Na/Pi symporter [Candidatus Eisenbacteria bacterium]